MEKTVTQYVILEDFYLANLTNEVNSYIEQGWQPLGAPFCNRAVLDDDNAYFHQAMVKYAEFEGSFAGTPWVTDSASGNLFERGLRIAELKAIIERAKDWNKSECSGDLMEILEGKRT